MSSSQNSIDLQEFFGFILNNNLSLNDLLLSYYRYHGKLNFGHQTRMYQAVITTMSRENTGAGAPIRQSDVIGPFGEIRDTFLEQYAFCPGANYLRRGSPNRFKKTEIFPDSPNQWKTDLVPSTYSHRSHLTERPGMEVLSSSGGSLFVTMFGYQYFSKYTDEYWPEASSRCFGLSDHSYPEMLQDRDIVVIQDQFDGSNFSHFLYDWVPRVIYFCEVFPEIRQNVLFVMGGVKGSFQKLFIDLLCQRFTLGDTQFYYPSSREIWNLSGRLHVFSDQSKITHPLNLCHPLTIRLVRALASRLELPNLDLRKLYISRADAPMRAIRNDEDVANILQKKGYQKVVMSEYNVIDQISLLSNADHIVGAHGMGLTNILLSDRISNLFELFSPVIGSDAYWLVSRAIGVKYTMLVGHNSREDESLKYDIDINLLGAIIV